MKNCRFFCVVLLSPSSRAEWVEIALMPAFAINPVSPSSRAEWVEIVYRPTREDESVMSPSSRAEWVEI